MASLFHSRDRWIVRWRTGDGDKKRERSFRDKAAAESFRNSLGPIRPKGGVRRTRAQVVERIVASTAIDSISGCWVWGASFSREGYGVMAWIDDSGRKQYGAHRVSFVAHGGVIPEGMQLDHLCRNRSCVNPQHLEPVTPQENILRSPIAQGSLNAAKTHCPQGHPYDEANTRLWTGRNSKGYLVTSRNCKACTATRRRIAPDNRKPVQS